MKIILYYLRIARIAAHLAYGMLICMALFPYLSKQARQHRIQRWSLKLLKLFRVRVNLDLAEVSAHSLIVSNHTSWLDIFVLNSLAPCRFVAKSDIRSWPLLGWLAAQTGTIFIARGKNRDVHRVHQYLVDQLQAGERIAFFPEGTTAMQGQVLPFHANLFEAAIQAAVPVQPFVIRYLNAECEPHHAVDFIGEMTFAESAVKILQAGEVVVHLLSLDAISTENTHRRELAAAARFAVAAALNVELDMQGELKQG